MYLWSPETRPETQFIALEFLHFHSRQLGYVHVDPASGVITAADQQLSLGIAGVTNFQDTGILHPDLAGFDSSAGSSCAAFILDQQGPSIERQWTCEPSQAICQRRINSKYIQSGNQEKISPRLTQHFCYHADMDHSFSMKKYASLSCPPFHHLYDGVCYRVSHTIYIRTYV